MHEPKYKHLLSHTGVRRWFENVSRGSTVTAEVYLRRLGYFCERRGFTPARLASMREREITNLLMDFVFEAEREGKAGSYIESVLKALKPWLAHNGRAVKGKIKVKGARETLTLKNERVPTPQELRRILLAGDRKTRVAVVLMVYAGLRIGVFGSYTGTDGLRLGDLPELRIDGGKIQFEQVPTMVVVRSSLSKAGHKYFTFMSEEGCEYLLRRENRPGGGAHREVSRRDLEVQEHEAIHLKH